MSEEAKLEDVIINLTNGKYSKREIIEALAWGEKNTEIYWPLMEKYQPKYYHKSSFDCIPILVFTIIKDLNLNN